MKDLYFSYFYNPRSTPQDGWLDRLTVECDKLGCLATSPRRYDELTDSSFVFIGFWKLGYEPLDVWKKAKFR